MPNRLTRVPTGPVPELPRWARGLVPVADAFMLAMLSRPATGSLRRTWVTPATLWLCLATVACGLPVGVVLLLAAGGGGAGAWRVVVGVGLILAAVGGAAVAVVGALQRRLG